jgi:hypothetical protein
MLKDQRLKKYSKKECTGIQTIPFLPSKLKTKTCNNCGVNEKNKGLSKKLTWKLNVRVVQNSRK